MNLTIKGSFYSVKYSNRQHLLGLSVDTILMHCIHYLSPVSQPVRCVLLIPHITDEVTETERSKGTPTRTHSQKVAFPEFEPKHQNL